MKNKQDYSEQIQRYLTDDLSPEELGPFVKELGQNNELRDELAFQARLNEILLDDEFANFKKSLDEAHEFAFTPDQNKNRRIYMARLALIAATFLILIALTIVLLSRRAQNNDEIFNQFYEKYTADYTTRDSAPYLSESRYQEAYSLYKNNDYGKAKPIFQSVIEKEPDNSAARFYLGISEIELNNINDAIGNFDEIINSGDQFYKEHAEWYKVLCLIKSGKRKAAMELLNSIVDKNMYYRVKAEKLISALS